MKDSQIKAFLVLLFIGIFALMAVLFYQISNLATRASSAEANVVTLHTRTPTLELTATWPPTWTPTPTWTPHPTRAVPPTPTRTPTVTPTPVSHVHPTVAPVHVTPTLHPSATITIPPPVPTQVIPDDAVTIVLLGSDQRPDWDYWNTDAIQYLVVYPDVPSVAMLSVPRDLYVYIPDFWMSRVNRADMYGEAYQYEGGGLGLLNQTLLYNLGISADYYVKVNFDGLIGLVNAMGGIEVPVHCRIEDYWPYPNEQGEYPRLILEPGVQAMDGELALWYSRTRKTTSVFDREKRQQQVLEAMWRKAKQVNVLATAPAVYEQTKHLFQTDLGMGNILALALTASQLDPVDVSLYNIGWRQVVPYTTFQGGNVYLPVTEEITPVIASVLAKPAPGRALQAAAQVEVWNRTGHSDWHWLAADTLYHYGYVPHLSEPDPNVQPQTQIFYFGESTKGSGLARLQWLFNVNQANTIHQADPNAPVKLRLVLGQDYNPCR